MTIVVNINNMEKKVKLDSDYIIKLIKNSTSSKDLGEKIKWYYNYIKNNS